jgi:hypothetical protein
MHPPFEIGDLNFVCIFDTCGYDFAVLFWLKVFLMLVDLSKGMPTNQRREGGVYGGR